MSIKRIDIIEKDQTTPSGGDQTTDIVYVPGLAKKGAVNVPTVLESEAKLIEVFGDGPIVFKYNYYTVTSDTERQEGKKYYTIVDTDVVTPVEKDFGSYYVLVSGDYIPTTNMIFDKDSTSYKTIVKTEVTGDDITGSYEVAVGAGGVNTLHNIDYEVDLSYIYAKELIKAGLTVVYERVTETNTVDAIYAAFNGNYTSTPVVPSTFDKLDDVGEYGIKFLTSGAYPVYYVTESGDSIEGVFTLAEKMITIAANRGDAVAVIDHTIDINKKFYDLTVDSHKFTSGEFGTLFTPWAEYDLPYSGTQTMPASFGYLMALAKSIITNANYLAVAGVARGHVPYIKDLKTDGYVLTNSIADSYQDTADGVTAINPITDINPYGLTIWGNRTLLQNADGGLKAGSYLNLRNMLSDIKKELRKVALSLLFEQNSDVLWLKFKSRISPLLDKMVAGNGIEQYGLFKVKTNDKSKLSIDVVIKPIYPVESVSITVVVTDDDVTVA